jgi:hypothetical protein
MNCSVFFFFFSFSFFFFLKKLFFFYFIKGIFVLRGDIVICLVVWGGHCHN